MNSYLQFSQFTEEEEGWYLRFRLWKDRILNPVCHLLFRFGVRPVFLSFMSFFMVFPFFYFFPLYPWLALGFLILNILFDALDGSLARFSKTFSLQGAALDIAVDHFSFAVFFFIVLWLKFFDPFWGAMYLVNYVVMLSLILFCRSLNVRFFPVIRSKYFFYLLLFFWIMFEVNYFDFFLVFFSIYMLITNIFLFRVLKSSLPS